MSEQQGVSLRPGDAQEGGFLDDADVTIKTMRAATWDYRGKAPKPCAAIEVTYLHDDKEKVEYYRVGDLEKLVPSGDKKSFLPTGTAGGIMARSKGFYLITSLINAGFPEDKVGADLSVFDGTQVHVNNTTLPDKIKDTVTGQEKENKALLVTKILSFPWDAKAKGSTKKAAGASKPAAATASAPAASAPAGGTDVSQKAIDTIGAVVSEAGGTIKRVQLNQQVFRKLAQDSDRNAIIRLVGDAAFLQGLDGTPVQVGEDLQTLAYDGTTVSFAAA